MPEMTPRAFSFNSPHGACPDCQGLGAMVDFDPHRDRARRVEVAGRRRDRAVGARRPQAGARRAAGAVARLRHRPRRAVRASCRGKRARCCCSAPATAERFEGLLPNLRRRYDEGSWAEQEELEPYRSLRPCPTCHGQRLKPQSLSVKVKGRTIADYVNLPIAEALDVFDGAAADRSRGDHRRADPAGDPGAAAVPERRRRRLPDARPQRGDAVGRRRAAHPAGDADRREPHRRAVRARRAVDRPAPARQPQAAGDAGAAARSRQHRHRRRARRGDDPRRPTT